jgi:signal peptidase I
MKNILKTTFFAFLLIVIGSCENDDHEQVKANGFELRASTLVTPLVLNPLNDNDIVAVLDWDKSDNGVVTVSNYKIEIFDHVNDPGLTKPVVGNLGNNIVVTNDSRSYTLTVKELNSLVNQLENYHCGQQMQIDIRIKSILGAGDYNEYIQRSNPITVDVAPYSTAMPTMAIATDAASAVSAPKIASSSIYKSDDYEGYVYLQPGTYQLFQSNSCGEFSSPTVYGIGNTSTGTLVLNGSGTFTVATAGHYFIRVNLSAVTNATTNVPAMSYSINSYTSFGIFGAAKGAPTGVNKAMTYDTTTNEWKLTFDFFKGRKFKFRSINGATPVTVLGGTPTALTETGLDIKIPGTDDGTKQKYDLVLNVSNTRNYTYTLTLNPL